MALECGDFVGLHHSLGRLAPALSGHPVAWDNGAFAELQAVYAEFSPAKPQA